MFSTKTFSWDELEMNIKMNTLANLRRSEADLKKYSFRFTCFFLTTRYNEINYSIKESWNSIEEFILWRGINPINGFSNRSEFTSLTELVIVDGKKGIQLKKEV
jgi:hypothetical protein